MQLAAPDWSAMVESSGQPGNSGICGAHRKQRPRGWPKGERRGEDVRRVKVREVIRLLERDGWALVATRGSHRQYKHSAKAGRVTVAGKPSDDLAPGTLNSILKQARLKERP